MSNDLVERFKIVQDKFLKLYANSDEGFRGCGLGSENGKPTIHVYVFSADSPLFHKCIEMDDFDGFSVTPVISGDIVAQGRSDF